MASPKASKPKKPKPIGVEPHALHAEYVRQDRERFERDRAMVLDPGRWPRWPLLPVKHRPSSTRPLDWNRKDAFGFVFAGDISPPPDLARDRPVYRVYYGVVFGINAKISEARREATGAATWAAVLAKYDHYDYEDIDAMMEVYTVD